MNEFIKLANTTRGEGVRLSNYPGDICLEADKHGFFGRVVIGHTPAEGVQTLRALIDALVGTEGG